MMLPERITYHENLPFSIGFSNIACEHPHYHKEMEMSLILRGTACYKIHHQDYILTAGDVLIVDTEDLHRIHQSSEDMLMLTMYVDLEFFNDIYPNIDFMIFACEECGKESAARHLELQNKVSFLRHHLAEIMVLCDAGEENELLMEKIHQFIFTMVNQFQGFFIEDNQFKSSRGEVNAIDLDRLYRIIKYIYVNYDQKITLDDLAELEHLSPYYVSHLIKETSGLSFQNFLNYVRVEYAEKLLAENKLTLTQISEFCGFSSTSYFNKCFKTWHDLTPSQYKKHLIPCQRSSHGSFSKEEALTLLKPYLNPCRLRKNRETQKYASHHVFIPVRPDYSGQEEFHRAFPLHIFAESASDILRLGYYREQILRLAPGSIKISQSALETVSHGDLLLADLRNLGIETAPCRQKPFCRRNSVHTAAEAFSSLLEAPSASLRLFGSQGALFTMDGLPTPYYTLYQLFSGIQGKIAERRQQYLLIKDEQRLFILLHQDSAEFRLNAHLRFPSSLDRNRLIVHRILSKDESALEILKNLGEPNKISGQLKEHICDAVTGTVRFACIDKNSDPKLDLVLEPNMLIMLEITEQ